MLKTVFSYEVGIIKNGDFHYRTEGESVITSKRCLFVPILQFVSQLVFIEMC